MFDPTSETKNVYHGERWAREKAEMLLAEMKARFACARELDTTGWLDLAVSILFSCSDLRPRETFFSPGGAPALIFPDA